MKITLTHDDVLVAVREHLVRQGFRVPDVDDENAFGVFFDAEHTGVTIEVDNISVAPAEAVFTPPTPVSKVKQGPPPTRTAGRFDPEPPPPREKQDVPDRVLDDGDEPLPEKINNEKNIRNMVAQSNAMLRQGPDPVKAHKAARERFPKVQIADSLEDFGKEPSDYQDEI
jgi:hypothetical protein